LLALARQLVGEGHEVVFFTTAHYRDKVEATGASFVPFAKGYDAHDLMVANPERESSSKRGVRGVKGDLRRIFVGPIPGQHRDLRTILDGFPADCIVVDPMFLGALPLALGPRAARPALACIGVMPYASNSRDTAPFGAAFQPGSGPLRRVRNVAMNWATEHLVLAGIQRFARRRLAETGAPRPSLTPQPRASLRQRSTRASSRRSRVLKVKPMMPMTAAPSSMFETRKKVRASLIRKPSPESAAMNSAATMTKKDRAKPRRSPVMIFGRAAGSTT